MNNNYIYIADNSSNDIFNIEIPAFDAGSEIPPPPDSYGKTSYSQQSEFNDFAGKSFTSFGTMAVCIVIFLVIVLILKKRKNNANIAYEEEAPVEDKQQDENDKLETEEIPKPSIVPPVQGLKKFSSLNTPSSIHKCILSFLENTKEK